MPKLFIIFFLFFIFIFNCESSEQSKFCLQAGHNHVITKIVISNDSNYILTGDEGGSIKLWDVKSGKEIRTFLGHENEITAITFDHKNKYMLSSSKDQTVKLWDLSNGDEILNFIGFQNLIFSLNFSFDDKYAVIGCWDSNVYLFNIENKTLVRSFKGHKYGVNCVRFTKDDKYIISGGVDRLVKIWNIETGTNILTLSGHTNAISAVASSNNGKYILSGSADKTLRLWDFKTGKQIQIYAKYSNSINVIKFSEDDNQIYSIGGDVVILHTETFNIVEYYPFHKINSYVNAISKNGSYIALSRGKNDIFDQGENDISLYNLDDLKIIKKLRMNYINLHLNILKGTDLVYFKDNNKTIEILNSIFSRDYEWLFNNTEKIKAITISNNYKYMLIGYIDNIIKLWDIELHKFIKEYEGCKNEIRFLNFSKDNNYFISLSIDSVIQLWDVKNGKIIKTIIDNNINFKKNDSKIILSLDNRYIIDYSGDIKYYSLNSGKIEAFKEELMVGQNNIVSDNLKYAVTIYGMNNTPYIWNLENMKKITDLNGHSFTVKTAIFSPNNDFVITGSEDNTIKLWEVPSGKLLKTFSGHTKSVEILNISKDGRFIISGSKDNTIKLWDLNNADEIKTYYGHSSTVTSVYFSNDEKFIISNSLDGTTRFWNIKTGDWIAFIKNIDGSQWLLFTNDGYWDSSSNGGDLIAMVRGMDVWNIDQFAVKNNRPDIILKRLESNDKEQIQNYYIQYIKRLIKYDFIPEKIEIDVFENKILKNISKIPDKKFILNNYKKQAKYYILIKELSYKDKVHLFTIPSYIEYIEELLDGGLHIPDAEIIETNKKDNILDLTFKVSDSKYNLYSYNIYINDVPMYGGTGKKIEGNNLEIKDKIELSGGNNKIEVSCLNEKLAESYRDLRYMNYDKQVKGNLYYIGFGASSFKDSEHNLLYPHKDVKDLENLFRSMGGYFDNIYTKSYINSECTIKNIKKAKIFLSNTTVNDTVVLFIAGHGKHTDDAEAKYYYITYETDLNNLDQTAADFELIEDILDGIKPRKKLFLMDTCKSGELDEEIIKYYYLKAKSKGLRAKTTDKVVEVPGSDEQERKNRSFLLEKDRFIYNDIFRHTGAIVFSSSQGSEFSYEPLEYFETGNGYFTGEIIKSFKNPVVDENKDGYISTDEMRKYVIKAVSKKTEGLQNPTVDRDNIHQKILFPMLK